MRILSLFLVVMSTQLFFNNLSFAQNDKFLGSWIAQEPTELDLGDQSIIIRGIDFFSANESPRYEGWLEEGVSHEELNAEGARDGLNIFVYKINETNSALTLKIIESRTGLEKGTILDLNYQLDDDEMKLMLGEQQLSLKRE